MTITNHNFEKTIISTIDNEYLPDSNTTYYLDYHLLDGKKYFTVSKDEKVIKCFDDESEAKDYFYGIIIKN